MHRASPALLALPLALLFVFPFPVSATDCSSIPGTRPATASDAVVQNGQLAVGTCYNPTDSGVNQGAEQAKVYLRSIFSSGGKCSELTPEKDKIDSLNPSFAVCAAKFLQAVRQQDPSIRISSAYRTGAQQQCMCGGGSSGCAAANKSNHRQGIALDLSARNYQWLHQQIDRFPGLRYLTIANDPYHMEAVKGGPCMTPGYMPPNFSATPLTSSLPFDNNVRQALGMQPPPPPPPPPQQQQPIQTINPSTPIQPALQTPPPIDTLNSTPYPPGTCSPQTYCSQSDGNIYYRATTCVDQVYQKCAKGCSGVVCNATSTGSSVLDNLLSPSDSNNNTNTNTNSNGTSTFDLIDFFANPPTATNVGTATPVDITDIIKNTGNASTLQPGSTKGQLVQTPPQGSNAGYGPVPQETFQSGDLSNSPGYTAQLSTFQNTLSAMKATLIAMLPYLQPFGGRIGTPQIIE